MKIFSFWLKLSSSRKVRFFLHVRVGFCVICFVGKKSFLKASTQPKASTPPLSLFLSNFLYSSLGAKLIYESRGLGFKSPFCGGGFFISAHSHTSSATSSNFLQKAITSSSGSRFQNRFFLNSLIFRNLSIETLSFGIYSFSYF